MKGWSICLRSAAVCGLAGHLVAACSGASTSDPGATGPDGPDSGEADAASGSKDDAATTTPDGATVPSGPDTIQVVVEPTDKAQALLAAVQGAKSSIHMTMYLMNDREPAIITTNATSAGEVSAAIAQDFAAGTAV